MTILILSKKVCPYTTRLLTMLDMMKIDYNHCVVESTTNESLKKSIRNGPVVYNNGEYIGTYEDITSAYLKGILYDKLQEIK